MLYDLQKTGVGINATFEGISVLHLSFNYVLNLSG